MANIIKCQNYCFSMNIALKRNFISLVKTTNVQNFASKAFNLWKFLKRPT